MIYTLYFFVNSTCKMIKKSHCWSVIKQTIQFTSAELNEMNSKLSYIIILSIYSLSTRDENS